MNIYLVGFMGTGKSSVGRILAKKKKWNFIDLDELIELKEQRRIADIFAKEGEPYFRKIEKKALKEVVTQNKFVVACGGGIVLDKENIRAMKQSGVLVCLSASPKVILERASKNTDRPLLSVGDPARRIEFLLKIRAPYYMQADKIIDTSCLSIGQVVERISRMPVKKK